MVLHRRRSKLSNVLCFINTPNLPLHCSSPGGHRMMNISLSCWDTAQKFQGSTSPVSWQSANGCLQPWTELQRARFSPIHPTVNPGWVQLTARHGPESLCKSAEETRAKQSPGGEHVQTLHPSRALHYPEAQPLRNTVLFTEHRHTLPLCLFLPPPSMSTQTCK